LPAGDGPFDQRQTDQLLADLTNLRHKLDTLPVIEQSKGILMGRYSIDADTAFQVLCRWSSHHNIKLHTMAQVLVTAATHPAMTVSARVRAVDEVIEIFEETKHVKNPALGSPGAKVGEREADRDTHRQNDQ
jgi:hypothetical protein